MLCLCTSHSVPLGASVFCCSVLSSLCGVCGALSGQRERAGHREARNTRDPGDTTLTPL